MHKALILIAVLTLVACTPHSMMEHPPITSEEVFLKEMIPHHEEAVMSSMMVLDSQNPQVQALAQDVIAAQEIEIQQMREWLDSWYPDSTYESKYMPMMHDLEGLEGEARDTAYLEGMKEHHIGAIEMARQAQSLELHTPVRALTDDIIREQEREVALIDEILR